MKKILNALIFLLMLGLAGCGSAEVNLPVPQSQPSPAAAQPEATPLPVQPAATEVSKNPEPSATAVAMGQIANPASQNCVKKGGQLDIRKDASGGEFGVCVFPNGQECEEWALLRGTCSVETGIGAGDGEAATYQNVNYGFELNYPNTWKLEEQAASGDTPLTIRLTRDQSVLTLQVKRNSETPAFGAAAPEGGEIRSNGTLRVLDQDAPRQDVLLEGKVKSVGVNARSGDLEFRFQLDNSTDPEIPAEIMREMETILASLKLKS